MKMRDKELCKKTVGRRFREIRLHFGMNQGEFSDKLGCGRSNISLIETGINLPGGGILMDLRAKFKISLDWLFFGEVNMFIDDVKNDMQLLDFLGDSWEVKQMLENMKNSREVLHRVLSDYLSYTGKRQSLDKKNDESALDKEKKQKDG